MYKNEPVNKKIAFARMQSGVVQSGNTNNWDLLCNTKVKDVRIAPFTIISGYPVLLPSPTDAFIFVREGNIIFEIDTNHYDIQAGQLALLPQGAQVICHLPPDCETKIYKIDFSIETENTDLFTRFDLASDNHVIILPKPDDFNALCEEAMHPVQISESARPVFLAATVMHMVAIYFNERLEAENTCQPFLPVIAHMNENLGQPLSISALSHLACMSPEYFIRRFRQVFACPPMKYYDKLRIKKAIQLLLFSEKNIHEIGSEIGLHDAPHFTRFFRNACGLTPSEYRSRFRETPQKEEVKAAPSESPAINVIPGNVFLLHAHGFWLEDRRFNNDRMFRPANGDFAFLTDMDKLYIVRQNQVAFLPAGRRVRYTLTNAQNLSYYRADFDVFVDAQNFFEKLRQTDEPLVVDLPNAAAWDNTCFLAMHNDVVSFDVPFHLLRTACMAKLAAYYATARNAAAIPNADRSIESVSLYMQAHPNGSATVAEIAEHFGIEPSYFIRKFKKAFGCTPKKYYDKLRADAAADMLLHTEQSPLAISKKVGFSSLKYFNSFFTERIGVTPEEYRRLYQILRRVENTTSTDEVLS